MNEKKTPQQKQLDYAKTIANELIEMIKAGTAPFQQPWEPAFGTDVPYNYVTGKPYSGSNEIYLMMQNRSDPRWLTYRQAQSINAQVRKGERGIGLIRLITHSEKIERDENGKPVLDDHGEPVIVRGLLEKPYIKNFTVFNAEQIDGLPPLIKKPLPELTWSSDNAAERILIASKAKIEHKIGNSAYYEVYEDKITLPEKAQFPSAGAYYATAMHELAHWTGHESRLNRRYYTSIKNEDKAREELRAEIASMMINRQLGIPYDPKRHAAYVGGWVKFLQEDPIEILHACRDAQKIQTYVLDFQKQQEINSKPEPKKLTSEEDLFNRTKEIYLRQNDSLSTTQVLERMQRLNAVEQLMANSPNSLKVEALTNFYKQEIKAADISSERIQSNDISNEYER